MQLLINSSCHFSRLVPHCDFLASETCFCLFKSTGCCLAIEIAWSVCMCCFAKLFSGRNVLVWMIGNSSFGLSLMSCGFIMLWLDYFLCVNSKWNFVVTVSCILIFVICHMSLSRFLLHVEKSEYSCSIPLHSKKCLKRGMKPKNKNRMVSYFHRKSRCRSTSKKRLILNSKTCLIQLNEIDHLLDESNEIGNIMHNLVLISNELNKVMKKFCCCQKDLVFQKAQMILLKLLI